MNACIFGATGFIGSHVAEQLVLAKHHVVAIVRPESDTTFLDSLGIDVRRVDFSDVRLIEQSIDPQSVVYNCLAYRGTNTTLAGYRTVEVDLTRQIVEACVKVGVKRYVQLSSIIAYGSDLPPTPIDESFPPKPELPIDRASWEREQAVREIAEQTGLDVVILQPASTIGQRDGGSFFFRILEAHAQNKFPMIGDGTARFSCVDTRDVGRAMVWLGTADHEVRGETFLLKGYDISWQELKEGLDQAIGVTAGLRRIPKGIALVLGMVLEKLVSSPPLNRRTVHALSTNRIYNDQKLRRAGFTPIYSFAETLAAAAVT